MSELFYILQCVVMIYRLYWPAATAAFVIFVLPCFAYLMAEHFDIR